MQGLGRANHGEEMRGVKKIGWRGNERREKTGAGVRGEVVRSRRELYSTHKAWRDGIEWEKNCTPATDRTPLQAVPLHLLLLLFSLFVRG